MGARGPKSTSAMQTKSNVVAIDRPRAPVSLAKAERAEWDRIVDSQPAEWLVPGFDLLLESYCRQAVLERREAAILEKILSDDEFDEEAYSRAATRLDRAARTKASLGVRLGFASTTKSEVKKPKKKPWQIEG